MKECVFVIEILRNLPSGEEEALISVMGKVYWKERRRVSSMSSSLLIFLGVINSLVCNSQPVFPMDSPNLIALFCIYSLKSNCKLSEQLMMDVVFL